MLLEASRCFQSAPGTLPVLPECSRSALPDAPGVLPECSRSAPGVHPECSQSALGAQRAPGVLADAPGLLAGSQLDLSRISSQPEPSWTSAGLSRISAGSQPDVIMTSAGSQPDPSQITAGSQPDPGEIFRLKQSHIQASGAENGSGCRIRRDLLGNNARSQKILEDARGNTSFQKPRLHHLRRSPEVLRLKRGLIQASGAENGSG